MKKVSSSLIDSEAQICPVKECTDMPGVLIMGSDMLNNSKAGTQILKDVLPNIRNYITQCTDRPGFLIVASDMLTNSKAGTQILRDFLPLANIRNSIFSTSTKG